MLKIFFLVISLALVASTVYAHTFSYNNEYTVDKVSENKFNGETTYHDSMGRTYSVDKNGNVRGDLG